MKWVVFATAPDQIMAELVGADNVAIPSMANGG